MQLFGPLMIVYVVWGSTYLALKVAVEHLPPLTLSATRFLIAGLILYAWCAWRRRRNPDKGWRRPNRAEWKAGAIQGLLLPAAGTGGATWAEQELSSGVTALLLATIPLWIVSTTRVVDKERIGRLVGLGLLAGIAGVGVLVNPFTGGAPAPLPAAVALGGALCWGLGSVYGRHAAHPDQPLLASSIEMLCAGVALGVLGGLGGEFARIDLSADVIGSVIAVGYLIVFGSLVAYSAYEWLLRNAPARITGTYALVNPVVAVLLGWWLLDEELGPRTVLAAAVIAVGVALIVLPSSHQAVRDTVENAAMTGETMVPANGVDLCVETFGEPSDPPVLLIAGGASSMDWWEDEFCRRLAAGGRFVIRYDHRDTGRSTTFPPGAARYSQVDMADDALGLLDALGERQAHLVGLSLGGWLAQRIAVDHPSRPLSLTLMSTTPAPDGAGPEPGGDKSEEIDWSDRKTAVDRLIAETRQLGGPFTADEPHLRRLAERVFDRTTDLGAAATNHWLAAAGPPIRERLGAVTVPALVMHGTVDPLFGLDQAEALVREIPGARLVKLEGVGHEFPPPAVWSQVVAEILKHTA